ncbi:13447_t:CDS:2, partial [Gigaspora rosea]
TTGSSSPKEKVLMVPNGAEYEEINYQEFDIIINKDANDWSKQLENENLDKNSNENIDHSAPVLKLDEDPYEKVIAIFHSSGSTSFPKLVPLTNRYFLLFEKNYKTDDIVLTTPPLFHIYGAAILINTIFYPGSVFVFPIISGSDPLVNEILHSLNQSKANILYTLPATIEQIYKNRILIRTSENSSNIPWNAMKLVIPESNIKWIDRSDFLDDAKELVIKKGAPNLSNIKGNTEDGGYRIGDLFLETPKGSGFYLLLGRADDTIVHSTGEKTNPIPIEDTIRLNSISNNDCPSHSRIFDEMVYILPLEGKTIPRTIKNNVQRKKVEIELKEEIKMLYDNFENAKLISNNKSFSNNQWNEYSVKSIILDSLKSAIGDSFSLTDNDEILYLQQNYELFFKKQFPDINLPHDVIFEYNTFQSLTQYLTTKELSKISSTQSQNPEDDYKAKLQALKNEVNSYIQKYNTPDKFRVTGFLGSFILRDLLNNPNILKVYCLVRASNENHGCDLGDSKFGQTEKIYSKLVQEVTQIHHVAWRLDFNNKIETFERDNIVGTVHLLMLAREAYTHHQN